MPIFRDDKWLFICSANLSRSPTAEYLARRMGMFARSCGTAGRPRMSNGLVVTPITTEILQWADVIVCMREGQRTFVLATYPEAVRDKPIYVWGLRDEWAQPYHPEMIMRMEPLLLASMQEYDRWCEEKAGRQASDATITPPG